MAPLRNVALIFGISGQDGAYLSRFLLERGYAVHGTSRDKEMSSFANLHRLNIHSRVSCIPPRSKTFAASCRSSDKSSQLKSTIWRLNLQSGCPSISPSRRLKAF